MRKPDFILVGAQKCGTTWLWRMISEHPQTDLPKKKEIHFFGGIENYQKGIDWYLNHFKGKSWNSVTGEASTTYFYDNMPYWHNPTNEILFNNEMPKIAEIIKNTIPDVKIIVVLRNPVDRAISAYTHVLRVIAKNHLVKKESSKVWWSLITLAQRNKKTRIIEYGYYDRYLKVYKNIFGSNQLKVIVYEDDMVKQPLQTIKGVYQFLGIDDSFIPNSINKRYNQSWGLFSIYLEYCLTKKYKGRGRNLITKRLDNSALHKMLFETKVCRNELKEIYKGVIENTKKELGREITW